jgi:hypothetical protein
MKTTKVITEVQTIINSGMKIAEKEKALAAIKTEGRPGCADAQGIISAWRDCIRSKKLNLTANRIINSKAPFEKFLQRRHALRGGDVMMSDYIYNILDDCHDYGFSEFADRFREAYTTCCNEYLGAMRYRGSEKTFAELHFHAWHIFDSCDCWQVADKDEYTFRREVGKRLGKVCAPFLEEYRRDILPVINEQKATLAKREEEDSDWRRNFGISKYRSVMTGTLDYITSPLTAGKGSKVVMFPYAFMAYEDVDEDWEYYSKAWHSAHGPKRTVVGREVRVYKYGQGRIDTIELAKWKPGFMVEMVAQVLGLQQPKMEKQLRKFQPSPWVDVKRSVKRDGVQFYNLTMGKYTVGVVAYDEQRDIHFHADTREAALDGLRKKIDKIEADKKLKAMEADAVLTADYAHNRWGFCWPGMTEFADAVGFDIDGSYTVAQLREAVGKLKNKRIIAKYRRELETARIINY